MTVLGRGELIARMRSTAIKKKLVISPILSKGQIGAGSVDLRMGNVVLMVRARGSSHVDPADASNIGSFGEQEPGGESKDADNALNDAEVGLHQKHERYEIPFDQKFLLHPGSLALVPTLEWIKLPRDIIGTVTARSTWAREGLSIATATLIEPNYEGIVTLELANLGQIPITLYPGLRIAQIALAFVKGKTRRTDESQFKLSFEPRQGEISKGDGDFIPQKDANKMADEKR
jgi:dCTP deaminase